MAWSEMGRRKNISNYFVPQSTRPVFFDIETCNQTKGYLKKFEETEAKFKITWKVKFEVVHEVAGILSNLTNKKPAD